MCLPHFHGMHKIICNNNRFSSVSVVCGCVAETTAVALTTHIDRVRERESWELKRLPFMKFKNRRIVSQCVSGGGVCVCVEA